MLLLSYKCIVTINVLWPFLTVSWVGLQCVIVVFPDHTHLFFLSVFDGRTCQRVPFTRHCHNLSHIFVVRIMHEYYLMIYMYIGTGSDHLKLHSL